jgi:hypothetical protein
MAVPLRRERRQGDGQGSCTASYRGTER